MNNEMLNAIEEFGIDKTAELLSEYVSKKILTEDIAIQFILEEIEAASQGNEMARQFALSSGYDEDDYKGAMYNSFEEVDGANGPQQEILNLCMMLYPNQNLMTELRIKTVDHIMKYWELGKYSAIDKRQRLINVVEKINDLNDGIFANINNDLNESITENHNVMILMSYGYARRVTAAGLCLQGVFSIENYTQAKRMFTSLQVQTGQTVEFQEEAFSQALELLQSYDSRLTKIIVSNIIGAVESDQIINANEHGKYFDYEYIINIFSK